MTDQQVLQAIRLLLSAEEKPKHVLPIDLLQVVRLLAQRADEEDISPAQGTLADQLGTSRDSIMRSQERLAALGWLIKRKGGHRGHTNTYQIAIDKLPIGDLSRTVVSDDARHIARQMQQGVSQLNLQNGKKFRFQRGWFPRWSFNVQKMINRSGGDVALTIGILNFAHTNARYKKRAILGPSALLRVWRQLKDEYKAQAATE